MLTLKPIPERPELDALIERSRDTVAKMTPLEKVMMKIEQRQSWVVGTMMLEHEEMRLILKEIRRLQARVSELELEGAALSAGVCEHRSGDEHGNPLCLKTGENI